MSVSVDPDHFFQTSASIAETERRKTKSSNKNGKPIQLPSKITAVVEDPIDTDAVFIAESTGSARRIRVKDHEKHFVYRGATAPLTSLAVRTGFSIQSTRGILYAACWDKTIHSWNTVTGESLRRFRGGHTDFVKCIITFSLFTSEHSRKDFIISGGADGAIVIWDSADGSKISVLKGGHSRGILFLAVDPEPPREDLVIGAQATVFSAGSDREVRRWAIAPSNLSEEIYTDAPIIRHETSVNQLLFDADSDLWTASADGTVKNLVRARDWATDLEINHDSNVRCVTVDEQGGHIITAGRDEDIKVWDRATGKLRHTYVGHYNEITGMVILQGQLLVSVSLDGTVRSWSLKASDLDTARTESENSNRDDADLGRGSEKKSLMTADEERELEKLMEDSD